MKLSKLSSRTWLVAMAIVIASVLIYIHESSAGQPAPKPVVTTSGSTFSYPTPNNWAALSSQELTSQGAVSGIASTLAPVAYFMVAVEPADSTPSSDASIKTNTLDALNRLASFELLSSGSTAVSGHNGQQFIYLFGSSAKTKQDLVIVVYNKQAYSLLFSSDEPNFASHSTDLSLILSGFKFK